MYRPLRSWHDRERDCLKNGYVIIYVPEHPKSFMRGWYYEHRLVMEKHMGRILNSWETVHHINDNKACNFLDNLFLCTRREHDKAG